VRFDRLDLNLLVALDALLSERNVSQAADRICLSQSATSAALSRLRDFFGDELLVQTGRRMVLTAKAESLIEPVKAVLEKIRATITRPPQLDPTQADRLIRIMASDYVTDVLLAPAINQMLALAPGLRFEIHAMSDEPFAGLDGGLIDLLITIDYALSPDHPSQIVFEDEYVVVGWSGNPAMAGPMTIERYFDAAHVTARFGRSKIAAFEDWFIRKQKRARRNVVTAPSLMLLPSLVIGSNRLATMHRRHASILAEHLPLIVRELPFEIPPMREAAQWHLSSNDDAGVRWVVERIAAVGGTMDDGRHWPEYPSHDELALQFIHQARQPQDWLR
jgi:LysR family transcriptional regulator, nod-box dependent transcriptional activator